MTTLMERMVPVTIIALPSAMVLWVLLAARRRRRFPAMTATFTAAVDTAILLCGGLVFALVTAPAGDTHTSTLHLIPGEDLVAVLTQDDAVWQIAGNLVLLAPLAALVSLRLAALRSVPRIALAALIISVGIEALQYVLHVDRVTSADDVLLNTIGAAAGAGLTRGLWRGLPVSLPRPRAADTTLTMSGSRPSVSAGH